MGGGICCAGPASGDSPNCLWKILFVDMGVPEQLLSDRVTNLLSELIQGVCEVLGVEKINTSGYPSHPQTDRLVEK